MSNQVVLTFAGDAEGLSAESKKASSAVEMVGSSAISAAGDMEKSGKSTDKLTDRFGKLGAGVSGSLDAFDAASGALSALSDLQRASTERAQRQARAISAVEDAQLAANQATRDSKQASIDAGQAVIDEEQANLDAKTAQKDYNAAVKEHGKNSDEAKQKLIDLHQAQQDVKQAQEDGRQALQDQKVAAQDAVKAQMDLKDAQREANPPTLEKWAKELETVTPLLSAVAGVIGVVTLAQTAWNLVQLASPTTWIVLAIVALIGVIILIVTHLDVVKKVWHAVWNGIKSAAAAVGSWFKNTLWGQWIKPAWDSILHGGQNVWNWMKTLPGKFKSAFSGLVSILTWPFRTAFNLISSAWNNTVGKLHWTIPGWVPGIGGNSIGAPMLPHFHGGGTASGAMGGEFLAVLRAGETVNANGGGADVRITIDSGGSRLDDLLVDILSRSVRRRGGNVQLALGGRNAG